MADNHFNPNDANVPIIGAPIQAFEANVQVVALCKCRPDNKPFIIPTINAMCRCHHCGKTYLITSVTYNKANNTPLQATVGMAVMPSQPGVRA